MKKNSGFTLVEVLVSMLILALGLLGLAGLQSSGLRNNVSAYNRSQATILAYDMADRMRANVANSGGFSSSKYITATNNEIENQADCLTVSTTCSTTDMALQDLFEWHRDISAILPAGTGTISQSSNVYTIAVTWDDDRDGNSNNNPSFEMSFRL